MADDAVNAIETAHAIALCAGCAKEASDELGVEAEAIMIEGFDGSCRQCGATLVGYFYRVPEDAAEGMAPVAGLSRGQVDDPPAASS